MKACTSGSLVASRSSALPWATILPSCSKAKLIAEQPRAWDVVGDDHERRAGALALEQQPINLVRRDRVKACTRFVDQQDGRIERHGARETCAFSHSAG